MGIAGCNIMGNSFSIHEIQDIMQDDQRQFDRTVAELRNKKNNRLFKRQANRKNTLAKQLAARKK